MVIGFAVGYYLGAKAGRERYRQLNAVLERIRADERVDAAARRARDLVDQGAEAARHTVDELRQRVSDEVRDAVDQAGTDDDEGSEDPAPIRV